MITIISGTNRPDSNTLKVATHYFNMLKHLNEDVHLLSLLNLDVLNKGEALSKVEKELLFPSDKLIFVLPEYNGSFPGVLKLLVDNTDVRKFLWYKKALLVGVADGRGGNLRGLDDFSNILHYLRVNVFYNKLPLSKINEELDADGLIKNEATKLAIDDQIHNFLKF